MPHLMMLQLDSQIREWARGTLEPVLQEETRTEACMWSM